MCETLRAVQKHGNTCKDFFRSARFFLKRLIKKKKVCIDLKRVKDYAGEILKCAEFLVAS